MFTWWVLVCGDVSEWDMSRWAQVVVKCAVLCHHSPRWISLTFRQDPLYLDRNLFLYMQHHCHDPFP